MKVKICEFMIHFCLSTLCVLVLVAALSPAARVRRSSLGGFKTNTDKRTIDLIDLRGGGPGKDGILAIGFDWCIRPSS